MILQFNIEILPEHPMEPIPKGQGLVVAALQQKLGNVACKAGGKADKPLRVLLQKIVIDPGTVVKAVQKGLGIQLHQILIADLIFAKEDEMGILPILGTGFIKAAAGSYIGLHAKDGFDPRLGAGLVKIDDAVHGPMVGDGKGGLSQGLCPGYQLINPGGAV